LFPLCFSSLRLALTVQDIRPSHPLPPKELCFFQIRMRASHELLRPPPPTPPPKKYEGSFAVRVGIVIIMFSLPHLLAPLSSL